MQQDMCLESQHKTTKKALYSSSLKAVSHLQNSGLYNGGGGQMYWSSLLFVQGNIKRHIK